MKLTHSATYLGTAKDNRTNPIHDWYRFTAGFSYKLVDEIIKEEALGAQDIIYESFAGCGTTLVSAQKKGIYAIGNESQELLFDVIKAKLNWDIDQDIVFDLLNKIKIYAKESDYRNPFHDLLKTLYIQDDLFFLYLIRDYIQEKVNDNHIQLFLKLALTQTLHKVSVHPIAVPYISRSKLLSHHLSALEIFNRTVIKMLYDLEESEPNYRKNEIFLHDSRILNDKIPDNYCTICITSPPYLNNLDYGEVSKVCSHFYGITDNWNDITEKVRKHLVTGSTTHYKESEFVLEDWKKKKFYLENKKIVENLMPDILKIKKISGERKGKKSFDILALYYFEDMYYVFLEMRRILRINSKAYMVLGDSAPYGVFINTTHILGEIALNAGFNSFKILKIRDRGTKWTSLKNRHSLKLSESILVIE